MATECPTCNRQVTEEHICPRKFYEWTVKISVTAPWVADGFDLTADRLHDAIRQSMLGYAHSNEVETEVVAAPDADEVAKEMGYPSAAVREMTRRYGK